ncbi:MAG: S49 family peptidase [Sulfurimonas sp.]|nr:S49 family peptidase [Sulfurimonas sp.]
MSKILRAIEGTPWLSTPETLRNILAIANREHDIEALSAKLGKPLDNSRAVETRDGIAIIPIVGSIVRYSSMFTEICGGVSTETLAKDLNVALEDPSIHTILLNIDSGGGEASGISELAEMIYDARAKKTIVSYISDQGASAAYWIASATNYIAVSNTSMVGSIGVVFSMREPKKGGIEIVSSVSPYKRPDILSEDGKAQIQNWADILGEIFVESVATYRGVAFEKVTENFGQGDLLIGRDALEAGMVDEITTFEKLISNLS